MMLRSFTLSTINHFKSRRLTFALLVTMLSLGLNSCKKDPVDSKVYGAIAVVNASPTVATYDFFLNDTKINPVPVPAGGSMAYSQVVAGGYTLKSTLAGRAESELTKNITVSANAYQTYYMVGKPGALDGFMVNDTRSEASATQAFVRFVNASPDAPALDLYQGAISYATNKAFKTASGYVAINAGSYTFDIKQTSNGALKATTENLVLGANTYYTIMAKGLVSPAAGGIELPFSVSVLINK